MKTPSPSAAPVPSAAVEGRAVRMALPASLLAPDERALHALNRLAYGPRPGQVADLARGGLATWIERQLWPESIPDDLVEASLRDLPSLHLTTAELLRDYPRPGEMERPETSPPSQITAELQAARLVRAVWSPRQLQEVMVDFWFNHFNVSAAKGMARWLVTGYERDAIRPHVLGRFRDLLLATARHPAMLYYLDNWRNAHTESGGTGPDGARRRLNENYARELLELHTVGLDAGYTQEDVIQAARCLTGWTIRRPRQEAEFVFRPASHDPEEKRVLGHRIERGGGESDGIQLLEMLARHPATARFIATKLACRFVSDEPPRALVERAAETFVRTDGNIRAVMAAMIAAPEFWSQDAYRAKLKKPLDFVASAARALDVKPPDGAPSSRAGFALARATQKLGEPLYEAEPPTGYPDRADAWVSAGALLARMNLALDLTHDRLPDARASVDALLAGVDRRSPHPTLDRLLGSIFGGPVSTATRTVLARSAARIETRSSSSGHEEPRRTDTRTLAALVVGSPEFQRR